MGQGVGKMKKKPAKIPHLVNWYHGNFCARCGRFDDEDKNYGYDCYVKLQAIGKAIYVPEMTHSEFVRIIRASTFCVRTKRAPSPECPICRALKVPKRRL